MNGFRLDHESRARLRPALLLAIFSAGLTNLFGQGVAPAPQNAAGAEGETVELGEFTVTGSHIPTTETAFDARTQPIQVLTRMNIEDTGYTNTAELLQRMTVANGGSVPISNNATGFTAGATSTSLRGLGPEATLVLINGKRVATYPEGYDGTSPFVDLNSIPLNAIERIEVLKDGASATYGADAVAGVVNIILRRNFTGSELAASYGNTVHQDASETAVSIINGLATDTMNLTFGFNFFNREAIFSADRAYSAIPPFLSSNSSPPNLQLTRAAVNEARGLPANASVPGVPDVDEDGDPIVLFFGNTFANRDTNQGNLPVSAYGFATGRTSLYNFNETAGTYPEQTRWGGFASWERKLTGAENVRLYGDLMYQNIRTTNELAPSATGDFINPGGVPIVIPARTANPILTPNEIANGNTRTAAPGAFNPFNPYNQDISGGTRARLAEFGNRIYRDETDAFLATLGARASNLFDSRFALDVGGRMSRVKSTTDNSLVSISRLNRIMNANDSIFNPSSGDYLGTSTPYNPFGYYRNPIASNQPLVEFATVRQKDRQESEVLMGYGALTNPELFAVPAGSVGFAVGFDYRREEIEQSPDALGRSGDIIGSSADAITVADRQIGAVFAELEIPLASPEQNLAGLHKLSVNLAARQEEFVTSNRDAFVPKVGLRYQPVNDSFVVRATYGEGFREPSLFELFAQGLTFSLTPIGDPVTGNFDPEQTVSAASNRNLEAEESKSYNAGFVWTPQQLNGFTVALDFWRIERTGTVIIDQQDVVNRAATGGVLLPGERVVRDAGGNIVQVDGIFRNSGQTKIQGIDIATSYVWASDQFGRFDFGVNATYIDTYKIQNFPGAPFFEYVGEANDILFDNLSGEVASPGLADDAFLEWKGQVYVRWTRGPLDAGITGSYLDGFRDFTSDFNFDDPTDPANDAAARRVESTILWDAQVSYMLFKDRPDFLGDTRITIGVNNLLDEDPPFVSGTDGNANGYPGFLYSAQNQFWYVSLNKRL